MRIDLMSVRFGIRGSLWLSLRKRGRGGESPEHTCPRETRVAVEHSSAGEKTEHGG